MLLASCGAEEVLQGGVYAFCERHLAPLDRERTWMLNIDTVGSPGLVLLEGEGPIVMEDFFDRTWRDLIAGVAERERIPMRRGMRARTSTDSVVPSRMGIPTACLVSVNRHKGLSNYHQPSDMPETGSPIRPSPARPISRRRWPASSPRPPEGRPLLSAQQATIRLNELSWKNGAVGAPLYWRLVSTRTWLASLCGSMLTAALASGA